MGQKLIRFALETFSNVLQYPEDKSREMKDFFHNDISRYHLN
jgi:hypothetical protein